MSIIFEGHKVSLRHITAEDCTPVYVGWLQDHEVNKYLETRHSPQSLESVTAFVETQNASNASRLLAIIENYTSQHIGNLKIGPINPHHMCADLSYFIGNKAYWGNGFASEAIAGAVKYAFETLGLFSLRAGLYAGNLASRKALEKSGFQQRGVFPAELVTEKGREDHIWYSMTKNEYRP